MKQKLLLKSLVLLFALIAGSMNVCGQVTWEETALADLTSTDIFVIVGTVSGNSFSMSNNNGTSNAPTAAAVTIADGKITSTVSDDIKWNIGGNSTDGYTFYPDGDDTKWLYCNTTNATGNNNNMRVGTGTRKSFKLNGSSYLLTEKPNSTSSDRYVCIYNSADWRGYVSASPATTIKFYKRVVSGSTCATPIFSPAGGIYTSDQTVSISTETVGATIHYTTNGSEPTSSSPTYSMPIYASGVLTIKAIAVKDGYNNSDVATATYAILAHAGTAGDPYSVADARTAIDAGVGLTDVYVTGIVCEGGSSLSSGAMNYWISDDGTETNKFEVYQGKGISGDDFTATSDVKEGDAVVVYGTIKKFGDVYEFNSGSQLISLTPDARAAADLSWSESEIVIAQGATDSEYTLPVLSNPNSLTPISYNITGTDNLAVEVDGDILVDTDIVGSATVTAAFAGDASYKPGSASYTITVYDPTAKGTKYNPYTVAEVIDGTATGSNVYVLGYIVGEYPTSGTTITTSSFTTDANIALADAFSTSTPKASAIPVQLNTTALKNAWGNKTNKGATMGYQILVKGTIDTYFSVNGIKPASEVTAKKAPVAISEYKWATFVSKFALDFDGSAVKAYIVTGHSDNALVKTQMEGTVPANTPLLLNAAEGSFSVPVAASSTTDVSGNLLKAGDGNDVSWNSATSTAYVLSGEDGTAQFKKLTSAVAVPEGKAYLLIPDVIEARGFDLDDGTTVINALENATKIDNGAIYDLSGRRVENPTKGIYIKNGKKVIFK